MARLNAKSPVAEQDERLEKIEKAQLHRYQLQEKLNELCRQRETVVSFMTHPDVSPVLARFRDEAKKDAEALVTAEKKEIDSLQASVRARRGLIATLKAAYESEMEAAGVNLRKFEEDNALFLNVDVERNEVQQEEQEA